LRDGKIIGVEECPRTGMRGSTFEVRGSGLLGDIEKDNKGFSDVDKTFPTGEEKKESRQGGSWESLRVLPCLCGGDERSLDDG
jgi:hypothetical protein